MEVGSSRFFVDSRENVPTEWHPPTQIFFSLLFPSGPKIGDGLFFSSFPTSSFFFQRVFFCLSLTSLSLFLLPREKFNIARKKWRADEDGIEAPSPLLGWQSFVVVFGTFLLLFLGERVRRSGCDFGKNKLRLRCKEGWRGRDKSWPSLPSSPLLPGSLIPYTILFLPYPSLHGMGFASRGFLQIILFNF